MISMKLVLLNGHPGSGKSTICVELRSRVARLAILDVDLFRKFVSDFNRSKEDISLMWQVVHESINVYLKNNISVLVDRCIDNNKDRIALKKIAKNNGVPFQEIILYTKTLNCAVERVNNRPTKKLSKSKKTRISKDLIASLRKTMLEHKKDNNIISFDTENNSVEETVSQILKILKSG